jgi:hypothetical protein
MKPLLLLTGLSLLLAVAPRASANLGALADPGATTSASPDLAHLVEGWRGDHGSGWRIIANDETGYVRMLYGANSPSGAHPVSNADFAQVARRFAEEAAPLLGYEPSTLVEEEVRLLPLAAVGTSDKMSVVYRQEVNGIQVLGGWTSVLLGMDGQLLAIDSTSRPEIAALSTTPTISAEEAVGFAVTRFGEETGLPVSRIGEPTLIIDRDAMGEAVLAHQVRVIYAEANFEPEGFLYSIAARGELRVVAQENAIHHDVGGNVQGMTTPGTLPDTAANPESAEAMKYMRVVGSGVGTVYTDVNGDFNFAGATGPISVTFDFYGPYNNVDNELGAEYTYTTSLSGTGNSILLNSSPSEYNTSQANAFAWINSMRDWTRGIDPSDAHMDSRSRSYVNINSNCNAYYDGWSTNYYTSGGGCANTAYSTIIAHEQGHWQNDRYNTGNGSDGMGEGNADVWAMYQVDNPVVGKNFCGTGCNIRTGLNNRQYCGDGNGGCYGQVHNDGEVWMGAAWKVRRNLKTTHGISAGGAIADALFLGWMNGYNQSTIHSIIETQWLTLDDDNGNINDGTPNFDDIDDAFVQQGFPGVTIVNAPASATVRNGSGVNPNIFTSTSLPILGTDWTSEVDAGSIGVNGFVFVFVYAGSLPGTPTAFGELLLDPAASWLYTDMAIAFGGIASHSIGIPSDPIYAGNEAFAQGYLNSVAPSGQLTNAIDLVLGY